MIDVSGLGPKEVCDAQKDLLINLREVFYKFNDLVKR
jgi:hypothetical protein